MIYEVFYYIGSSVLLVLAFLFVRLCWRYRKTMGRLASYKDQKFHIYEGADKFPFGNLFDALAYTTAQKESE